MAEIQETEQIKQPTSSQQTVPQTASVQEQQTTNGSNISTVNGVKISKDSLKKWILILGGIIIVIVLFLVIKNVFYKKQSTQVHKIGTKFEPIFVTAKSGIPGVELSITNQKALQNYLLQQNVIYPLYVRYIPGVPLKFIQVKQLNLMISNIEQPYFKFVNNTTTLSSIGQQYDQKTKTMTINYYLSPGYLIGFKTNGQLTSYVAKLIGESIYEITLGKDVTTQQQLIDEYKQMSDYGEKNALLIQKYIQLTKK